MIHFFFHRLGSVYGIPDAQCTKILNDLNILHPYGTMGGLPWQEKQIPVPFGLKANHIGLKANHTQLLFSADQIKTYSERSEDEQYLEKLGSLIKDADTVIFLGFAYHPQNMELLVREKPKSSALVFGTALKVSGNDRAAIRQGLQRSFDITNKENILVEDMSCAGLFEKFHYQLSSR